MMENYKTLLDAVVGNLTGNTPPPKKEEEEFKIGDYVNYTPENGSSSIEDTLSGVTDGKGSQTFETEAKKWKIFDYDDDTITIISDVQTTQTLKLKGANGYNNGVYILNKICKDCYSNKELSLTARSINIEDVRGIMQGGFEANKDINPGYGYKYGDPTTYEANNKAPKIWKEFESGLGEEVLQKVSKQSKENQDTTYKDEGEMTAQGATATFYQTFWSNEAKQDGVKTILPWKDDAYADIMFGADTLDMSTMMGSGSPDLSKTFWLASRYVLLDSGYCHFGLQDCEFRHCVRRRSCLLDPGTPVVMRFLFAP